MKVVSTILELKEVVDLQKQRDAIVGFVPTMGALHKGHLSLVKRAGEESDYVVVSIFVNPTQFNNKEDLERYPRDLNKDLDFLENSPCDLIFAPSVKEMYPEEDKRQFDFGHIENVMEGRFRKGHFNGVAQIVSKLFSAVNPHKAFFGYKDFQQVAVIKKMVEKLNIDIEIVPCPIIRETDGLAMSSRNTLLSPDQRKNAVVISQTLFAAVEKSKSMSVEEVKKWVVEMINANPFLETEYFEIVDDKELSDIRSWNENDNKIGCIAVHCGKVRLIDNVSF